MRMGLLFPSGERDSDSALLLDVLGLSRSSQKTSTFKALSSFPGVTFKLLRSRQRESVYEIT